MIQGKSKPAPNNVLMLLNVNGCIFDIPTLCATKESPHISAVNNNDDIPKIEPLISLFIIKQKPHAS